MMYTPTRSNIFVDAHFVHRLALRDFGHAVQRTHEKLNNIPVGAVGVVSVEVSGIGLAVEEGITRLVQAYGSSLQQYTFPPPYAAELQAIIERL
jgi:hypothetical protein